ncbi:MAG: MFS transporter [Defluviitaleaceae bacterium]|nr:MFS transporter [Defluviitaleaceae bacterium]
MSRNKVSFYLIVISQGIGLIGAAVLRFAISLHVLDLTGSAEIFATMVAVSFLPLIVFTPLGGAIADRFSKKMMLVICDSANTLLVGLLAIMLFGGTQSVLMLGATITLLTLISAFYHPTVTASLPAILEKDELVSANGLVQGIRSISILAAPMLAAFLFGTIGVESLVGLCAAIFLFSALINIFIKIPFKAQEAERGIVAAIAGDLREGFLYITKENRLLLKVSLIFTGVLFFHQAMLSITYPYMVRVTLGLSEFHFGAGNAAIGAATLIGSLVSGKLRKYLQIHHMPIYVAIIGLATIPITLSAALSVGNAIIPYLLLVVGFMTIMFCFTLTNIMILSYVQTNVPMHIVGKVMALTMTIANASAPAGQFVMGFLIEGLAYWQFALYAGIALVTLGLAIMAKRLLSIKSAALIENE